MEAQSATIPCIRGVPVVVGDADLARLLGALPVPLFLVDAHAQIRYCNAQAHALTTNGLIARSIRGKLVLDAPQATRVYQLLTASDNGIGNGRSDSVALTAPDGSWWIVQVEPRPRVDAREAGLVILLRPAALDLDGGAALVSELFGLTPAERRALLALLTMRKVRDIAYSFGIEESTMRTHLHHIFAKTATCQRAELIRLVASFAHAAHL